MDFPLHVPFIDHLGIELLRLTADQAEMRLVPRPEHLNSFGVAHGGLLMTLLDAVMAHAARGQLIDVADTVPGVATIEMKTMFMRPGEGTLHAVGMRVHRTATMAFCEGRVYLADPDPTAVPGLLAASATGTFKFMRALSLPSRTDTPARRRLEGQGTD